MDREEIFIECPKFGDKLNPLGDKARRDYALPLDSTITNFFDNPVINSVFKQYVEMGADSRWGSVVASGVEINDHNYPEMNKLVEECVETLNIHRPYVIISSAVPGCNACTFGSDEEPYIALSSLLIKTLSPTQLKFVIGHECGHVAMGHMVCHTAINMTTIFAKKTPIIGDIIEKVGTAPLNVWGRRTEISADRAGLICCRNLEAAQRALIQIELPFMDVSEIDISEYIVNSEKYLKKGILRKATEFEEAHPILPKRIKALEVFSNSEKYYRIISQNTSEDLLSDRDLDREIEKIIKVL